jgi:hypothetical protein
LSDVPASYVGAGLKFVRVNAGETALQFQALSTGGFETLDVDYTDAGNVTTAETDLFTYTVAAGKLAANGDRVETQWSGVFVSSGTATRQLRAYFGGTLIFDSGTLTVSLAAAWDVYCTITRVSATVIRYAISMTTEGAALAAYTASGEVTGLTLSNTNIVKITGTAAGIGAATNDIVGKMGNAAFCPLSGGAINDNSSLSTSLSQISNSLSSTNSTNVTQSTSLSQVSSSLSGAISSTTSLSSAVSTVDSGQTVSLSQVSSSLSGAISSTSSLSSAVGKLLIGFEIDGGGSAITTGLKGYSPRITKAHTITKVTVLSVDSAGPATSCSITVDVWVDTYANFPPTSGDKISASAPATLSSATKSEDSTLTGWGLSTAADSIYGFSVASVTGAKKVLILLEATF